MLSSGTERGSGCRERSEGQGLPWDDTAMLPGPMFPRRAVTTLLTLALVAFCAGCPPVSQATRDGGTPCTTGSQCNPAGLLCGELRLCVQGYCTDTTSVIACRDGGYPDSGPTGNCGTYEDCNPPPSCGSVIACINFVCDPTTRLDIPCRDAGVPDGGDGGRRDASTDARTDSAQPDAGTGSDGSDVDDASSVE